MTVAQVLNKGRTTGNSVTVAFPYTIKIQAETDITGKTINNTTDVKIADLILNDGGALGFTVVFDTDAETLTVTVNTAPTSAEDIQVLRVLPQTQTADFPRATKFPAVLNENALDKAIMVLQDQQEQLDRSFKLPEESSVTDPSLPAPVARRALVWDPAEDGTVINSTFDPDEAQTDSAANVVAAQAAQAGAETAETGAETAETNAAASAALAALEVANMQGTSTTSLLIATGSKVFTTQADKSFDAGVWLLATSDADPTNYMHGQVTSYSGTTLTLNVTNIGGSGTLADWTIDVSGTRGSIGDTGAAGSVTPSDSDFRIQDNADATKQIAFEATGITTATTRTITMPDADVDLGNIPFTNLADGTDGELITWDATGAPAAVAVGTAAQVLTSNGVGAAPTFEDLAAGGIDIQTFTGSGTWTKPASGDWAFVQIWAGGGSGGRLSTANGAGAGGGGGAYNEAWIDLTLLSATESVTIGAGGAARTTDVSGNTGGTSDFASSIFAYGGAGGATEGSGGGGGGRLSAGSIGAAVPSIPSTITILVKQHESAPTDGTGGVPYGGLAATASVVAGASSDGGGGAGSGGGNPPPLSTGGDSINGGAGGGGAGDATTVGGAGGDSVNGGAGGGGGALDASPGAGAGGTSINAGGGGAGAFDANNATAGTQPGGGGGGSETGDSGAGGDGQCIVIVF